AVFAAAVRCDSGSGDRSKRDRGGIRPERNTECECDGHDYRCSNVRISNLLRRGLR
ncbi:unnamed protein product, partial [Amoebophrya sp. A120]